MNETTFFIHILLLFGATLGAKRLGREALMVLTSLMVVLANLFVTKQIALFGLEVTPTDAYIIGSLVTVNVLQEYFGKEAARQILSINTYILIFFAAMAMVQIFYIPSTHDHLHPAFTAVLAQSPRVFIASIIAFYISQRIDIECFARFRKKLSLPLSMCASLILSQACDTLLFSVLALYGIVHSILAIMGLSYIIKLITLFSMTPLTTFLRRGIPRGIQESVNSEVGALDLKQRSVAEAVHVDNMDDTDSFKDKDADTGSTRFLKHEGYENEI